MPAKKKHTRAKAKEGDLRIGNNFWQLRSKHGRDKIFSSPDVFLEQAYEYFKHCDDNPWYKNEAVKGGHMAGEIVQVPTQRPYTLKGLCIFLGITEQTFLNYENSETHKDFFDVFTHVREVIENNQLEGATVGAYNANIIGRLLGLADKQEIKHDVKADISNLSTEELEKRFKYATRIENTNQSIS